MKKLLSVVLAVVMTACVLTISAMPAMAANVNSPTASTAVKKGPTIQVNGKNDSSDVHYTANPAGSYNITFTYDGESGTLVGWDENMEELGFIQGTDYTIKYNNDGSLTINFISADAQNAFDNGDVIVEAIVEFDEEGDDTISTTKKKNDSSTSPATGAATTVVAGAIATACAGFAVLSAKKRDAE